MLHTIRRSMLHKIGVELGVKFTPCLHLGLPQQKSQLACFANWPLTLYFLVAGAGFEPATFGL